MASVLNMLNYKKQAEQPILVLVGLHESDLSGAEMQSVSNALNQCAKALATARLRQMPVAFVRCLAPPSSVSEPQVYPAWLKGFEPRRNDLVFDVLQASCYSNAEFSRAMDYSNGDFVIAGLFAETTCLPTAVDAYHRHHGFIYLSDASACRHNGAIPMEQFHDAVDQVISLYGRVAEGGEWSLGQKNQVKRLFNNRTAHSERQ
ncbi:MAG TPA: isochorismatase family protein [Rhizomicrobium sp.]|nr:isochorismatase family protein [Rhizomicrobium sp.]